MRAVLVPESLMPAMAGLLASRFLDESLLDMSILPQDASRQGAASEQKGPLFAKQSLLLPELTNNNSLGITSFDGTGSSSAITASNAEDSPPINTLGNTSFNTLGGTDWLAGSQPTDLTAQLDGYEREVIARALEEHDGVLRRAAKALGVNPVTLGRRAKRLGLWPPAGG